MFEVTGQPRIYRTRQPERRPRRRLLPALIVCLLFVACFAMAARAHTPAVDIDLSQPGTAWTWAGPAVRLPAPVGYCFPVERSVYHRADALLLYTLRQWAGERGRIFMAIAIDCRELARFRANLGLGFEHFVVFSTERGQHDAPYRHFVPRADYAATQAAAGLHASFVTGNAGRQDWRAGPPNADAVPARTIDVSPATQDGQAAYMTLTAELAARGGAVRIAGVNAAVLIHGLPVLIEVYEPYRGDAALVALEESARALVAVAVARNPGSEVSRLDGIDPQRMAMGTMSIAAFGGIVVMLLRLTRRRRPEPPPLF